MPVIGSEEWFALQVIPRHEKKVATLLEHCGCEHLLPVCKTGRRWSDRIKAIDLPLFPGYVFFRTQRPLMEIVRSVPGIIRIVSFGGKPHPVPEEDIEVLKRLTGLERDIRPSSYLNVGQRVRVVAGPLLGLTGIIIGVKKRFRLVLAVDLIMKSVSAEIEQSEVAPGIYGSGEYDPYPRIPHGHHE